MERVEPTGRGERKIGLRWRLVWFVLAESKGGGCSGVLLEKEKKGKVLRSGGLCAVQRAKL